VGVAGSPLGPFSVGRGLKNDGAGCKSTKEASILLEYHLIALKIVKRRKRPEVGKSTSYRKDHFRLTRILLLSQFRVRREGWPGILLGAILWALVCGLWRMYECKGTQHTTCIPLDHRYLENALVEGSEESAMLEVKK